MDTKISHEFWSDPAIEPLTPEQRLAALWLLTNGKATLFGYMIVSARRFTFETGLDEKHLASTLEALPRVFEKVGEGIWIRNFIRRQFGDNSTLEKSNVGKSIATRLKGLASPFLTERILTEYPSLSPLLKNEAPPKPLGRDQSRAEKSRAEQSMGSGEGANPDLVDARGKIAGLLKTDPTRPWSYPAEQALLRIVPIPESEFAAVAWLHAQPVTETRPKLRTNPTSLCEHWTDEVAKARQYAASANVTLPHAENSAQKKERGGDEPADWEEWHAALWPSALMPARWSELGADLRQAIHEAITTRSNP